MTIRLLKLYVSFLVIFGVNINGQTDPIYKCIEGTDPTTRLTRGSFLTLCTFIAIAVNQQQKMTFRVHVDEHSIISIRGSAKKAAAALRDAQAESDSRVYTWVTAGSNNATSNDCQNCTQDMIDDGDCTDVNNSTTCPLTYQTRERVLPFVNLRIRLNEGYLERMYWTNACYDCKEASNYCVGSPLHIAMAAGDPVASPVPANSNLTYNKMCGRPVLDGECRDDACDLSIVITWEGTDSKGHELTSKGYSYSWLVSRGIKGIYRSIVDFVLG